MHSGILFIDKPAGITSAGVVARVKRILGAERVGHAGTLDPDATGLLIVLVNGATRVASYAADGTKCYSGIMRLGVTTSTDDMAGEILTESSTIPPFEQVVEACARFVGPIQQVPPKVSAIKVGGKRAHKLSREGHDFELSAREVVVSRFDVEKISDTSFRYVVECSPGTYVRSLARDVGDLLGCGGAVESIRRERSGPFSVEGALTLEEIAWDRLRDWSLLIPHIPRIEISEESAAAIRNGHQITLKRVAELPEVASLPRSSIFCYASQGDPETLGLLHVLPTGELQVALNLGRYPGRK
jgi:tRNA pseudouridine55 synthase